MTATDWREMRAKAAMQDAAVYLATLEQLAELEECAADDRQVLATLRPFVGLLKTRYRDLTRSAEQLRMADPR